MKIRLRLTYVILACLAGMMIGGGEIRSGVAQDRASDPFDSVRRKIAQILKETAASGVAVAVAKDGKIIWEQGFGFTDRGGKMPVSPDTMFSLASLTKPMTVTGLMVLAERGLINLDRPVNDYLGEARLTARVGNTSSAAVRNLIFHTAGLPMHWNLFFADNPLRAPDMDVSIRRYGILTSAPGETYTYSNFGYGILGYIIARLSGKTYADFMKEGVFEPLGMTRTAILTKLPLGENTAVKYDSPKKEVPVSDFDHQGASAAYASVRDLVRFGIFHLGNVVPGQKRILESATLAAMHRESGSEFMDGDVPVKYLLGSFGQIDHRGYRFHVATGSMVGAVSRLDLIPSENIASAVLANSDNVDLWALQHEIFAALLPAFRNSPQAPKAPETGTAAKFDPPDSLIGHWTGAIQTFQKSLPAALTFVKGGNISLEIDGKKYGPLPVKTELGDMNFKDGVFSGLFWGRIDTPDTARLSHVVYINIRLREDALNGSAAAVSIDGRRTFCLPHWIELAKSHESMENTVYVEFEKVN